MGHYAQPQRDAGPPSHGMNDKARSESMGAADLLAQMNPAMTFRSSNLSGGGFNGGGGNFNRSPNFGGGSFGGNANSFDGDVMAAQVAAAAAASASGHANFGQVAAAAAANAKFSGSAGNFGGDMMAFGGRAAVAAGNANFGGDVMAAQVAAAAAAAASRGASHVAPPVPAAPVAAPPMAAPPAPVALPSVAAPPAAALPSPPRNEEAAEIDVAIAASDAAAKGAGAGKELGQIDDRRGALAAEDGERPTPTDAPRGEPPASHAKEEVAEPMEAAPAPASEGVTGAARHTH